MARTAKPRTPRRAPRRSNARPGATLWSGRAPGYVEDLDEAGVAGWSARVAGYLADAIAQFGSKRSSLRPELPENSALASVTWVGLPERVASCLTRRHALELLDAASGRSVQEEYLEWRVVRDGSKIRRIELTTELPEYWAFLAAHDPQRLLALVAEFAREEDVAVAAVFGRDDALDVSPEERESGFREQMVEAGTSPYNDGRRAICCMRQQSNTLASAAALAAAASTPQVIADPHDHRRRALRCDESIPTFWHGVAVEGRASDPLLVERLAQIAFEGREVALDLPVGLYIQNVEAGRLALGDGSTVPENWFRFSRGRVGADGQRRFQRLVVEDPDERRAISDLVDRATGERIEHGGQIADLVNVALFLRVSKKGKVRVPTKAVKVPRRGETNECGELLRLYSELEAVR